jgi:hypothetical protein
MVKAISFHRFLALSTELHLFSEKNYFQFMSTEGDLSIDQQLKSLAKIANERLV